MEKETPQIQETRLKGDEIISYIATKTVKPFSTTGHIILPKKLIGKEVQIKFKEDGKKEKS